MAFFRSMSSRGRGREGEASPPRRHAAGGRGAIPAAIRQDLVQLRHGIIAVMRLSSATGTSMFMSATRTLRATRAPASRQTRATARSSGPARAASMPLVAHAARWSPKASSLQRQLHVRGGGWQGQAQAPQEQMRNCAFGMDTASCVGATVMARAECGPAGDSSSARDARVRSERCVSHARSSHDPAAWRCHPRRASPGSKAQPRAGGASEASSRRFGAGSFNQLPPRWERAWASSPSTMPGCRSRSVGRVSAQEAQCAAGRIVGQQRPQANENRLVMASGKSRRGRGRQGAEQVVAFFRSMSSPGRGREGEASPPRRHAAGRRGHRPGPRAAQARHHRRCSHPQGAARAKNMRMRAGPQRPGAPPITPPRWPGAAHMSNSSHAAGRSGTEGILDSKDAWPLPCVAGTRQQKHRWCAQDDHALLFCG